MICTFGYVTSKNNSEAAAFVNDFFNKKFKKIYEDKSAAIVDRNPISCKVLLNFNCHFTDVRKIEEKLLKEITENFSQYPSIRFLDEYDTYNIIYEIKNPEPKETESKKEQS